MLVVFGGLVAGRLSPRCSASRRSTPSTGRDLVRRLARRSGSSAPCSSRRAGHCDWLSRPVVVVLVGIAGTMLGAVVGGEGDVRLGARPEGALRVLVGAGVVAVLGALHLGHEVDRASRTLGEITRRVGDEEGDDPTLVAPAPEELTRLAHELDTMRQRLNEARAREQRVEQSRRELIAWVSHDLRTPLAGILAMVEALNDGVVDDGATVARYLATIQREADRLAGLVDDLFELSRIQADALRLSFEPIAVAELVSDVAAPRPGDRRAQGRPAAGPCARRRRCGRPLHPGDGPGAAQPARQRHPAHTHRAAPSPSRSSGEPTPSR